MELQPFIFSLANTSYKNGVLMKPLAYVFPNDKNTYGIWDEYLLGRTFLVAPILDSTNTRKVYLPSGTWLDLYDQSKSFTGNQTITAKMPLEEIPVFVKTNSIYLTCQIVEGNSKIWNEAVSKEKTLNIHLFPGKTGESFSFDYVDNTHSNKEKPLVISTASNQIQFTSPALSINAKLICRLEKQPSAVMLNGKKAECEWNMANNILLVSIAKNQPCKLTMIIN
jgi:alpha-glucosidase (family GH31 glycosyl hydrolase)